MKAAVIASVVGALVFGPASADQYLYLRNNGFQGSGVSIAGGNYDSDGAIRYVCYDTMGKIETILTQRGHDARLCSCPAGDACLATDDGDIGDRVSAGQVETRGPDQ